MPAPRNARRTCCSKSSVQGPALTEYQAALKNSPTKFDSSTASARPRKNSCRRLYRRQRYFTKLWKISSATRDQRRTKRSQRSVTGPAHPRAIEFGFRFPREISRRFCRAKKVRFADWYNVVVQPMCVSLPRNRRFPPKNFGGSQCPFRLWPRLNK